jgi:uncharacterized integral membrane protein
MKFQWILLCTLIFALVTAIFAVINVEPVKVNFLFTEAEIPLILVILGSTVLGGLIVGFFGIFRQYRLQRTIRQLRKETDGLRSAQQKPPAGNPDLPGDGEGPSASPPGDLPNGKV